GARGRCARRARRVRRTVARLPGAARRRPIGRMNEMSMRMRTPSVLLSLVLAGCSVAPPYDPPPTVLPAAFKEAQQPVDPAAWKPAEPGDARHRGAWWTIFDDPELDALQQQALQANQTLRAGIARVERSRALARAAGADRLPQVDVGAGVTRFRA